MYCFPNEFNLQNSEEREREGETAEYFAPRASNHVWRSLFSNPHVSISSNTELVYNILYAALVQKHIILCLD